MGKLPNERIQESSKRTVISGGLVEVYEYERPYFYNIPPSKKRLALSERKKGTEKRADHILRARRSIRRIIEANVNKERKPVFITFTFAENIKTLKEANPLFSKCVKEMQRKWGKTKYLCVPEFQKRGAVHYHAIFFDLPYIPRIKNKLTKFWPHGYFQVKAIKKIQRIGAYVAKYLQKGAGDERTRGQKTYFTSRGIRRPIEYRNEKTIDTILSSLILENEAVQTYNSRQGTVIYKRLRNINYVYG